MGEDERAVGKLHEQEVAATAAFDEIDDEGNGYVMIDELSGLAGGLGLPIGPEEQDEALEELDGDGDGVLGREEWTKWWVQRWKANSLPGGKDNARSIGGDDSRGGEDRGSNGGEGGSEKVSRLAERARQARRRAGTDIHTAAWRGDLALVKDFLEEDPDLANAVDVSEFGTGYRPLHYAAYGGFLPVCEALHAAGARALAAGDNGVTALFLAAQAGKADIVRFLLDLGADPTTPERESGLCAADVAVGDSGPDILRQMQEKCDLTKPPALEAPPTVTRVEPTSLQAAFPPLRFEAGGKGPWLPVNRYKVKVERDGEASGGSQHRMVSGNAGGIDISSSTGNTSRGSNNTVAVAKRRAAAASSPEASKADGSEPFASPTLAVMVLVPAPTPAAEEARPQQRIVVRVGGLEPAIRYRVKVAAVNAIGYGPYGPASSVVVTPEKVEEDGFDGGSGETKRNTAAVSTAAEEDRRVEKGKGRQVLAMERRRNMAAQAARLQGQQQREAEERKARREQKLCQRTSGTVPARQLSATPEFSNGRHDDGGKGNGVNHTSGCDDLTKSTDHHASPHHDPRCHRRHRVGNSNSNKGSSARVAEKRAGKSAATAGVATTGTIRTRTAPSPLSAEEMFRQGPGRHLRRQQQQSTRTGGRPVTTGSSGWEGGPAEEEESADDGGEETGSRSRGLAATAPASGKTATEPRYLAATMAGRMSARAYRSLNDELASYDDSSNGGKGKNNSSDARGKKKRLLRGSSPFVVASNMSKSAPSSLAVGRPGRSSMKKSGSGGGKLMTSEGVRGEQQRQQRRSRGRAGGQQRGDSHSSQSDVSISSCGDMTISSEEQEGHELAYTG